MEGNIFYAAAKALWARGEDAEQIARELALAFKAIVQEGTVAPDQDEYKRLSRDGVAVAHWKG